MSNQVSSSSGGVGFFGLLFITVLVLKLTGVIAWSWWWVTAWGGAALFLLILAAVVAVSTSVGVLGILFCWLVAKWNKRRQ